MISPPDSISDPAPLVSVIVPNYNHAPSLSVSLPAIQAQTYARLEILFVDDRSDDESVRIARSMGLTVLETERNSGPAAARNLGAAHAQGEVLFFLDSDVAIGPDTVLQAVRLLYATPAAGAICGTLAPVPLVRDSFIQECRCLQAYYWRISSTGIVSYLFTALCAMRACVFREIGPFNERLRQTEEVEYGQRLSARYQVWLTSAIDGRHRDDDKLWPLLRKVFHRCRLRVPFYASIRRFSRGFETAPRIWSSLTAMAALVTVALPLLAGPPLAIVPLLLLTMSVLLDSDMYRFVLRRRGIRFGLGFAAVQFAVNVAITTGIAAGVVQWLMSPAFRGLYTAEARG